MQEYPECIIKKQVDIYSLHTFFESTYAHDFYFTGEAHSFWEAVFVIDGTVGITADDKVFYLHTGQMIFHTPMQFHRIWAESGKPPKVCVLTFSANNMPDMKNLVFNIPSNMNDNISFIFSDASECFVMEEEDFHIKEEKEFAAQLIINRLENLFLSIIHTNDTAYNKITSPSINNYALIINTLGKNIDKRLSLEEIASLCNMSVSALKKNFNKYSKTGIIKYFNLMKINRAKSLLMSGISVKETASMLGFEDQNYFSTIFKRLTSQSPSDFKA